ncbi:MAG: hypothetical protein ACXVQJ_09495, partial [Actinomycetota bacterium]
MVVHSEAQYPAQHPGFVAGDWEGLVTYRIDGDACEIFSLDAFASWCWSCGWAVRVSGGCPGRCPYARAGPRA